jgi:6-phosphogluconolactonase
MCMCTSSVLGRRFQKKRKAGNPAGSNNLDIAVSSDSSFVYSLNSGAGAIGIFAIQNDGSLVSLGEVDGLPKAAGFNGIAAL